MIKSSRHIFFFFAMVFTTLAWGAPSIKIKLDAPAKIPLNSEFHIEVKTTGIMGMPQQQQVPGAMVSYYLFNSANGVGQGVYTLHARVPGTYTFFVTADGVKSNTLKYTIVDSQGNAPASSSASSAAQRGTSSSNLTDDDDDTQSGPKFIGKGDGNLFMKASITKTKAYEQEALVYTVKLYSTYHTIKFIGATTAPKFEGFVVEESKATDNQLHFETYNGKEYASAVIARYIIFPQMTGNLKVIGNTYTVSVEERIMYHDRFWGSMSYGKPLQLNVTPNDLTVEVIPLPSPKPADFSGGVGKFNLSSNLASTQLKTNQPTPISYFVTGEGNLRYVQLPDPASSFPAQIELSSPVTDVNTTVDANNVSGTVKFEYTMIPTGEGTYALPPLKLVYFNPATGKYETSTCRGYEITVGKGEASAKSQKKESLEFHAALMNVGTPRKTPTLLLDKFSYWLFYIVPVALLLVAMLIYRRQMKLAADIEGLRARRAKNLADKWLKKAKAQMKKNDRQAFEDSLLAALWGYLGDKLRIKPSMFTRENVAGILKDKGVGDEQIQHLISLIDEVEMGKYSSMQGSASMQQLLTATADMLSELENSFSKVNAKNSKEEDDED